MPTKIDFDIEELRRLRIDEKKTLKEIAEIYNCNFSTISNVLDRLNIQSKNLRAPLEIGSKFADGNLIVIGLGNGKVEKSTGAIRQTYIVKCSLCQEVSEIRRACLIQEDRKCCKFCMKKGIKNTRWKGCGELSGSQFYVNQYSAKVRNIPFDITIEEAWRQYEKQEGICALSGEEIKFNPDKGWVKRDITASLDRIDSSKGYTVDNIQWISKDIQKMKMDYTEDELRDWCKKVSDYQNGLVVYNNDLALTEWKHHKNWRGYGNIRSTMYNNYMSGAKSRKLIWNIKIEDLWNLYIKQRGLCSLSGLPIDFNPEWNNRELLTASLDRIDPTVGYDISNIQWVDKHINEMKMDLMQDRFLELAKAITNHCLCV
jgi:hypothetical protein